MAKVLIVFPNPIATIPAGLTFVAKRFKQNGAETKVFINTFDQFRDMDQIKTEVIDSYKPDVVAFSFGTYNLLEVYRLMKMCGRDGYTVIAGGNHPTIRAEEVLKWGQADLVIRAEGELGIDDFCAWYEAGADPAGRTKIRGASFINEFGQTVHNKKPRRIRDIDGLGDTDFSTINVDDFRLADGTFKGLNVIACGRGCPFRCSYCSHGDWYAYFYRSPEAIINEMVTRHEKYGITDFWMADETFTAKKSHAHAFCDLFLKEKLPFTWSCGTRADTVDEALLKRMKEAGLQQVTYGIESADDETLRRINKGYDAKTAYETVLTTGRLGLPMYINLMTGFPWETPVHVENNLRFVKAVEKYVNCFQLYGAVIPYPDTPIYDQYHQQMGFTEFWLQPKYQNAGMVIYQNVANPYRLSTYFQRNLYDDTYVAEEYFFRFSPEYKRAVARMGRIIGWKSVQAAHRSPVRRYGKYILGQASHWLYRLDSRLEKRIVGRLAKRNNIHRTRRTASFVRT